CTEVYRARLSGLRQANIRCSEQLSRTPRPPCFAVEAALLRTIQYAIGPPTEAVALLVCDKPSPHEISPFEGKIDDAGARFGTKTTPVLTGRHVDRNIRKQCRLALTGWRNPACATFMKRGFRTQALREAILAALDGAGYAVLPKAADEISRLFEEAEVERLRSCFAPGPGP